jgi:hypothetical protein
MLIAVSLMCFIHPGHSLVGPDSEFPKMSRKQKKAAKAAAKAEKRAKKDGVKLLDPEGGDYGHETELEEGLHAGPQTSGQYAPVAVGGYQGYQPYGGNDVHNNYYAGGAASERTLS